MRGYWCVLALILGVSLGAVVAQSEPDPAASTDIDSIADSAETPADNGASYRFAATNSDSLTVYKTVDEQGVVSFSDIPPAGDQSVQTMEINAATPSGGEEAQQRLEDMRETTDRMAADRREREKHRAELRKQQAETRARTQPQYPQADYPYYGYTGSYRYQRYPRRRPGGGWHRPRPEHPIARPPLRPPLRPGHGPRPEVLPSRPVIDYPASLIRKSYSPPVRAAFER